MVPRMCAPTSHRLARFAAAIAAIVPLALAAASVSSAGKAPARFPGLKSLDPPAVAGSRCPDLAVSPDGSVYLSWFEPVDSIRHRLVVSRLSGTRWSPPRVVLESDSFFVNWADFPAIASPDTGLVVLAWPWRVPGGDYAYHVRAAVSSDSGANWTTPRTVHEDRSATEHGFVSMAAESGCVRLVWLDGRNGANGAEEGTFEMTVRTALLGRDGQPRREQVVDARVCDCCQTSLAATVYGAVTAYRDRSPEEVRDISLRRRFGPGWMTPDRQPADGWTITGCPVNGPALDAEAERLVLAWFTGAGDTARVQLVFSTDGAATLPYRYRVDEGAPLGRVDVVAIPGGAALVTWLESAGSKARWLARRVSRDGGAGPAWEVAGGEHARKAGFLRVVLAGERAVFAWTEPGSRPRLRTAVAPLR